jgi:diguanylate cyclase (GGDEF)-like protein
MATPKAPPHAIGSERRRVLVAAADAVRQPYLALRGPAPYRTWDVLEADSFERAHFILQMDHCDVMILDGSLYQPDDDGLSWLLGQHALPTMLVAGATDAIAALRQGAHQWLPRETVLAQPALLSESLAQLAQFGDGQRRARAAGETLQDSRRQVSRLVSLLWEVTPTKAGTRWCNQRHMMERLFQETSRCTRQGGGLSVVLGEMFSLARKRLSTDEAHALALWTAERLTTSKRRCDIAGQYGPYGFMLILPGTSNVGAVACCKRIQALPEVPDAPVPQLQVCFGITTYSTEIATVKALLSQAEEHLEEARVSIGESVVA